MLFRSRITEEQSLRYRPLTGPTSPMEPGLRLGSDIYQTPELAMRGRQAEELGKAASGLRQYEQLQIERIGDAYQLGDWAAADRAAAEAARAGRIAKEAEAANTIPAGLRTAATDVEGGTMTLGEIESGLVRPSPFGPKIAELPLGRAEQGVGALELPPGVHDADAQALEASCGPFIPWLASNAFRPRNFRADPTSSMLAPVWEAA